MEIKILNLREAYSLYIKINPVVVLDENNTKDELLFIQELIINARKLSPKVISEIVSIFTLESKEEILKQSDLEIIGILLSGMRKNKILSLMEFFKGFETWQTEKN